MAIMPHPERTPNGDAIFSSMLEYVNEGNPRTNHQLSSKKVPLEINDYKNNNNTEWIIDMIINDNEASSVQNALTQKGYDVLLSCLLYTSPSPRDLSTSRMPSSA